MASEEDSDRSESRQDRGASDVELTVASSPLQLEVKLSHDGSDVVDAQSVAVPPGTNQQRLQQMVCDQFGLTCSLSDVRCTCFSCYAFAILRSHALSGTPSRRRCACLAGWSKYCGHRGR